MMYKANPKPYGDWEAYNQGTYQQFMAPARDSAFRATAGAGAASGNLAGPGASDTTLGGRLGSAIESGTNTVIDNIPHPGNPFDALKGIDDFFVALGKNVFGPMYTFFQDPKAAFARILMFVIGAAVIVVALIRVTGGSPTTILKEGPQSSQAPTKKTGLMKTSEEGADLA
jgi:hypothetical protein